MLNAGLGGVKVWVVWRGVPQPLAGADNKQDTERTVDAANTTCFGLTSSCGRVPRLKNPVNRSQIMITHACGEDGGTVGTTVLLWSAPYSVPECGGGEKGKDGVAQ